MIGKLLFLLLSFLRKQESSLDASFLWHDKIRGYT